MVSQAGKLLIAVGAVLMAIGAVLVFSRRIPLLSRLNFQFGGESWRVYFPLGACLLLSLVLTLLLWLLRRF